MAYLCDSCLSRQECLHRYNPVLVCGKFKNIKDCDFDTLKQAYNNLKKRIALLHKEQRRLIDLMQKVCPHKNIIKIEIDGMLAMMGLPGTETKYKCDDCFKYFTEEEFLMMQENRKE